MYERIALLVLRLEGLILELILHLEDTFELCALEGLTGLDVLKGLEGHY